MDARELIGQYKAWPLRNRLLLAGALGIVYPVYVWMTDIPPMEEQLAAIQTEEGEAKNKYEKVKKEQENLPKLETEFKFVQDQLAKAKGLLPEKIAMEDILQKTASIARETRIVLKEFSPASEQDVKGEYRYAEMPVALSMKGGFGNIMTFYDRIVHLAGNVRLRGLSFTPGDSATRRAGSGTEGGSQEVDAKVSMVFFRSTDTGEVAAKDDPAKPKKPKADAAAAGGGE